MKLNFSHLTPVPLGTALIDTALSKTQRGTPTVVHPQFHIVRIRGFYMRKVRRAEQEFSTRLGTIVEEFPRMEDIHPFYGDLINVLYDRDHYKLALGHVSSTKGAMEKVSKEFVKLLKFADSPYRCKQLKRAALGRMAHYAKKLGKTLEYLEEVRMHMTRLPAIDPATRTLLLCGFPNVGKSSFMNKVSRADVEVEPYAFTTRSLYVGHFDYNYLQWQVIDTPGILDHPLEERNTIEMLSITALAHVKAVVLYFVDLSETCGSTIEEQISLFNTLSPLLDSHMVIVLSKRDILKLEDMEDKSMAMSFLEGRTYVEISTEDDDSVEAAKRVACELMLDERVEEKVNSGKIQDYINRITVLRPKELREKAESFLCERRIENTGNEQDRYFVKDEYKHDIMPEIMCGKNIADFLERDILQKLNEVEEEENRLFPLYSRGWDVLTKDERETIQTISSKIKERRILNDLRPRTGVPIHIRKRKSGIELHKRTKEPKSEILHVPEAQPRKKAKFDDNRGYYDRKPKHLYRTSCSKRRPHR
jgi:nucleolar GTP-binding protein